MLYFIVVCTLNVALNIISHNCVKRYTCMIFKDQIFFSILLSKDKKTKFHVNLIKF